MKNKILGAFFVFMISCFNSGLFAHEQHGGQHHETPHHSMQQHHGGGQEHSHPGGEGHHGGEGNMHHGNMGGGNLHPGNTNIDVNGAGNSGNPTYIPYNPEDPDVQSTYQQNQKSGSGN